MAVAIKRAEADPIAIINMSTVARRMGITDRTIRLWLAKDIADKTPGKHFPVPMSSPTGRVEWREATIVRWLESREAK